MSVRTYSITKRQFQNFYLSEKNIYQTMLASIAANGYGQVIYNYLGPNKFRLNSYHIWSSQHGEMMVYFPTDNKYVYPTDVGVDYWGVSSDQGLNFLNGTEGISGLVKIKYCNTCTDSNALPYDYVDTIKKRLTYLEDLFNENDTETGYIFVDPSLPRSQRFFPAIRTNTNEFRFKNHLGVSKSKSELSSERSLSLDVITTSLETPERAKVTPCRTTSFSYSRLSDAVCNERQSEYDFNQEKGLIYEIDSCGLTVARNGFYSDGDIIYEWDGDSETLNEYGPCSRAFNGPWAYNIIFPEFVDNNAIPPTTYVGFAGAQDGTPTNTIQAFLQLTIDPQTVDGTRNQFREIYKYEVFEQSESGWGPAYDRFGRPVGYGDYSLDKNGNRNYLNFRQSYNPTTQQWTLHTGEYQLFYTSAPAFNGDYYFRRTPFQNYFYQRIFKILIYPIWQDDTSYQEIIVNAGDTSTNPYVISSKSFYQGSEVR